MDSPRVATAFLLLDPEMVALEKLRNEVTVLKYISTRTTIPVPKVLAVHLSPGPDNHDGLGDQIPPFILETALRGRLIADLGINLGNGSISLASLSSDQLSIVQNFYHDLAQIHVSLSSLTFPTIGSLSMDQSGNYVVITPAVDSKEGPFESPKEYFLSLANKLENLALSYESEDDVVDERSKRLFTAKEWRRAINTLLETNTGNKGPFPLRHGDLHQENILVDENGHITGVLDWDCAAVVPWEVFGIPSVEQGYWRTTQSYEEPGFRFLVFNSELTKVEPPRERTSGRLLSEWHKSEVSTVGSFVAYFMETMGCDYELVGRSMYYTMGWGPIDVAYAGYVQLDL